MMLNHSMKLTSDVRTSEDQVVASGSRALKARCWSASARRTAAQHKLQRALEIGDRVSAHFFWYKTSTKAIKTESKAQLHWEGAGGSAGKSALPFRLDYVLPLRYLNETRQNTKQNLSEIEHIKQPSY